MKKNLVEVYGYYRSLHPNALLLFHVGNEYIALFNDAIKAAGQLGGEADNDSFRFPADNLAIISKLGDRFKIVTIDYRNDRGEYDFPDVHRLKEEKELDY